MRAARIGLLAATLSVLAVPAFAGNDLAKGASVVDHTGQSVRMSTLLRGKTSLVVFYRGHW